MTSEPKADEPKVTPGATEAQSAPPATEAAAGAEAAGAGHAKAWVDQVTISNAVEAAAHC